VARPRRTGSATVKMLQASSAPGTPSRKNTACQERTAPTTGSVIVALCETASTMEPPKMKAVPEPIVDPIENTVIAMPSRWRGNRSVIIAVAAGTSAASPAPTQNRAASSCG
jgi:hypothetical protein